MPTCTVLECKNTSTTKNLSKGGVTYHRFPKGPFLKEKWIEATGRQNWFPGKTCTICSDHFSENDFDIKKSGKRYIVDSAIPSRNILHFVETELQNEPTTSSNTTFDKTQLKRKLELDAPTGASLPKQKPQEEPYLDSQISTPRNKKLTLALQRKEKIIRSKNLEIRRLKVQNCRLKKKISKIEDVLKTLEDKFLKKSEDLSTLKTQT